MFFHYIIEYYKQIVEKKKIYNNHYFWIQTKIASQQHLNNMFKSQQIFKQAPNKSTSKRVSIGNMLIDKLDAHQKLEKQVQKNSDKCVKLNKKFNLSFKQHKFQTFDLTELQNNKVLIKNNRKFATMLDSLRMYNRKLISKRENNIINYKLYQFFYSTLRICNTKTQSEVDVYLKKVDHWYNQYNSQKRQLFIHPKKKKHYKIGQQDIVRQTFVSNLPLQIDQYERKIFADYNQNSNKIQAMGEIANKRGQKIKSLAGKLNYDSEDSDSDECMNRIRNEGSGQKKRQQFQLPDLRSYKNEILKMRKIIQQRQQKQMIYNMRKNQSRIETQSSNNFYKQMRNRNDIFNKTSNFFNRNDVEYVSKKHIGEDDSLHNSRRENFQDPNTVNAKNGKQNFRLIVNSTSLGFHHIKKNNLNSLLGLKKKNKLNSDNFPKFFSKNYSIHNQFSTNLSELNKKQNVQDEKIIQNNSIVNQGTQQEQGLHNVSGIYLIRNPFQLAKAKKQKRKK